MPCRDPSTISARLKHILRHVSPVIIVRGRVVGGEFTSASCSWMAAGPEPVVGAPISLCLGPPHASKTHNDVVTVQDRSMFLANSRRVA